jgi:membrane-bound lytic murein transglycosylase B
MFALTKTPAAASSHLRSTEPCGYRRVCGLSAAICAAVCALVCGLALLAAPAQAATKSRPTQARPDNGAELLSYGARDDVMRFAAELAEREKLDAEATRAALAQARFVPSVARLIMPAANGTAKNWAVYRGRFVEPVRIEAGLAFWRENERWLQQAEERYGVPAATIVGIIGVETIFGRQMGGFRVIDALATLSFDFPTGRSDRSPFFRNELEQFLLWCAREGLDPLSIKGSYAGAIGMPQFMPSSIVRYGIDFDGDGHIDLHSNPADVIGSVAHYLAQFGWERDLPTHYRVMPPTEVRDRALLLVPDIVPTFSAQEMTERGAVLDESGRAHDQRFGGKLALVELQNGDAAPSHVAGTSNFYVITRYNWSSYYALAVIELGEAIRRRR